MIVKISSQLSSLIFLSLKVCDISPFYGKLNKFSSQVLSVWFCSDTPVKFEGEALINIQAGPLEVVPITAITGEIEYVLSATELNFGKQVRF